MINKLTIELFEAIMSNNIREVNRLIDGGADANAKEGDGITVLMCACAWGDAEIAKLLLKKSADVNVQDKKEGQTALMIACVFPFSERIELVKLLLKKGADVNLQDKYGQTALMGAYDRGYSELANLLLKHGADVNLQDKYGMKALDFDIMHKKRDARYLTLSKFKSYNFQFFSIKG